MENVSCEKSGDMRKSLVGRYVIRGKVEAVFSTGKYRIRYVFDLEPSIFIYVSTGFLISMGE